MYASDADRKAAEARPAPPQRNGAPSLSERVRSLRLDDRAAAGPGGSTALPWFLCALLLLTTVAFGYRTYRLGPTAATEEAPAPVAPAKAPTAATATAPAPAAGDVVLESKGYAIAAHPIQVSPNKVSGRLAFVDPRLKEGNRFQEGEVLARIEDNDYRARRDKAAQLLAEAQRRLKELETTYPDEVRQAEAKVALVKARLNLSQFKAQVTRDARDAVSREQREEALLQVEQDRASLAEAEQGLRLVLAGRREQIEQARARVEQARQDLAEAQWMLDNCEIRAPISGTILKKNAERGNFVNPGALSSGSSGIAVSLCDMADLADLEVEIKVQERDIAKLAVGMPCRAMPEAFMNDPAFRKKYPDGYAGTLTQVMPIADRAQGAVPVRVKLDIPREEEGVYVKPEMGVIVSFRKQ
jgi:HlyD family secretion protein